MSLQVWLPLTKDLRNQGLSNVTITNNGATFNSAGKLGGCYNLNNSVGIGATNITLGNTFSIACWIKVNSYNSNWANAFKIYKDSYDYIGLCMNQTSASTKQLGFHIYKNNGSSARTGVYDAYYMPLTVGTWYHLCFIVTPSEVKTYQNGINIRTGSITTTFPSVSNYSLSLGKSSLFGGLDCSMNDFRLYNHALSQMEVKELSKGLVLHYPLNRGGWGQENLYGYGSDLQTTLSGLNNYNNGFSIIEEEGKKCAYVSGALKTTKYLQSKLTFTPTVMEQFTFSAEVKIKNIIRGTTNPRCEFYFSGVTLDGAWRGFTVEYIKVDGQKVGATAIGFDRYLTDTAWHKVAVTAHFNYNGTSTIPALYPNIYLRDCTGDLYIRNVKLEKGPVATPWCPNSSDALATTMGLNSTTEYDCSGFCNNGTRTGTFSWTSDTPKYVVSTVFNASYSNYIKVPHSSYALQGAEAMTVSVWAYMDDWTSFAARIYSSTESGGYNIESSGSNLQWSVNVYTAADKSTYGYANSNPNLYLSVAKSSLTSGWHMFIWVYDTTSTHLYIDGILKVSKTATSYGIHFSATAPLIIGGEATGTSATTPYFTGKQSDFRIYATALSAEDVKSLYQNSAYIDSSGNVYGAVHSEV